MNKILFVAWRAGSPSNGEWGVVGRLDKILDGYRFIYTKGAYDLGFEPFRGMPDLNAIYESDELFPFFKNRLLTQSRPEYHDYLEWSGFSRDEQPDPIAILSITEGRRATDSYEVFPCPSPDGQSNYRITFFVHGIRYMPDSARNRILKLNPGEKLRPDFEDHNPADTNAVGVCVYDHTRELIGYIPRYLAYDIRKLGSYINPEDINIKVKRVNVSAPVQQRLLCQLHTNWPVGFEPCSDEQFQPIREWANL